MPVGATEEDAVLSIAKAVWRKRRVQKFLEAKLFYNTFDPSHPSYDQSQSLRLFRNLFCLSQRSLLRSMRLAFFAPIKSST